jgi:ribosomal protein L3 glutamine methyltransferase
MMTRRLHARLVQARSYEEWVRALGAYFREGGVCFGHGTDNAEDEAFWLVRHLQGWRDGVWDDPPDRALVDDAVRFARRRVAERVPLAYVIGEGWFAGMTFIVDRNVLVPRSPLVEVIERGFAPWAALAPGDRVLEVGTGSGCIAIAAAVYCEGIEVDATDISPAALAIAARNAERHGVSDRVHFHNADLFPAAGGPYRVIISNPPYVPTAEVAALPAEYQAEPALGLAGGPTGVEIAERLIRDAGSRLTADGVLIVEVGGEAETLLARHPRLPAVWIELERGGDGVFVLTAEQLSQPLL